MNFIDLAKQRYSVRSYQSTPVDQEKLAVILEAGRIAPTAANCQPNRFLVLNQPDHMSKLAKAANAHGAPLAILVCGSRSNVWTRPFDHHSMLDIDAAIATDHMMLCAEDLGISSCWLTYFDPAMIRREFQLPDDLEPINILVLGYSADTAPQSPCRHDKTRIPLEDMIYRNCSGRR